MKQDVVFFDIEPTSKDVRNARQIKSMAAKYRKCKFTLKSNDDQHYQLYDVYSNGKVFNNVTLKVGLKKFINFLIEIKNKTGYKIVLLAHNSKSYDSDILIRNFMWQRVKIPGYLFNDLAFVDSVKLIKSWNFNFKEHNLDYLINEVLEMEPRPKGNHDAWKDVMYLKKIVFELARRRGGFVRFMSKAKLDSYKAKKNQIISNLKKKRAEKRS